MLSRQQDVLLELEPAFSRYAFVEATWADSFGQDNELMKESWTRLAAFPEGMVWQSLVPSHREVVAA